MARVGIDLDGVIYDFNGSLRTWLRKNIDKYPLDKYPFSGAYRWEFYEDWGLTQEEFVAECHAAADAGHLFRYGEPLDNARSELNRLRATGHVIVLITDRSFGTTVGKVNPSELATLAWIKQWDIPYDELHFTANKTTIPVDYMIDDRPKNFTEFQEGTLTDVWLRTRPWNKHSFECDARVESLRGYVSYVINTEYRNVIEETHVMGLAEPIARIVHGTTIVTKDEVNTVSSTGGQKGTKLARFDLIPNGPLWSLAELYGKGAMKYDDRNWEKGYEWSLSFAAAERHLRLFWSGVDIDSHKPDCEPGCTDHTEMPHLACAAFHCFAMMEWSKTHPEFDNRVKEADDV